MDTLMNVIEFLRSPVEVSLWLFALSVFYFARELFVSIKKFIATWKS